MRETREQKIERAKKMLQDSQKIVCFMGIGAAMECGAVNFYNQEEAYRIEDKYHYSPEEIYSTGFYSARAGFFFNFYENEILSLETKPNETFEAIKRLEDMGKLRACVTRNIYALPLKAGISNVIELRGNIYNNVCTKCGMNYPIEYIKAAKEVPRCEKCKAVVRPAVTLHGEMIRNDRMTAAANACQEADMFLLLGSNLQEVTAASILRYFQNDNLVLISKKEHFLDKRAKIVIHDEIRNVLPSIIG